MIELYIYFDYTSTQYQMLEEVLYEFLRITRRNART